MSYRWVCIKVGAAFMLSQRYSDIFRRAAVGSIKAAPTHSAILIHPCKVISPRCAASDTASVRLVAPNLPMIELT
jgi:hypothetical protein